MDLCSVDFYVERAKISRTFNHGAFWNKLNIYPSARLGKKIAWEFFFVCSQEKSPWEWRKKEKKKNQATLSNMWVSFYWFIRDYFDAEFLWKTLRLFPHYFHPSERRLLIWSFIFVHFGIFPLTATRDCWLGFVFLGKAELSAPLSLTHTQTSPVGTKLSFEDESV